MITFFRKIRKDLLLEVKISKYFKYAFGEIILVVIGILIALQINNWNVRNKKQDDIKEYAKLLIQDLQADLIMIDINMVTTIKISNKIDSLFQSVQNKKTEDISNIDFICLTWNLLYRPYKWNRATLDQLKNSGSIQYIKNFLLAKKIAEYDAFTKHMDEDYLNDKSKADYSLQLISKIINTNYININKLRSNVLMKINNPELQGFYFYTQPEYLKAKASNLKLITTEINNINEVINSLLRLEAYYDIRSGIELPQLKKDAEELIVLLRKTYIE